MQDVRELVVHGLEELLVHHLDIGGREVVGIVECDLQTTLSLTKRLGTRRRVQGRRADDMNDARAVELQERLSCALVIDIIPQIFRQHCDFNALLILARHEVLLHVRTDILHLVEELQVVGLQEVHFQECVERE